MSSFAGMCATSPVPPSFVASVSAPPPAPLPPSPAPAASPPSPGGRASARKRASHAFAARPGGCGRMRRLSGGKAAPASGGPPGPERSRRSAAAAMRAMKRSSSAWASSSTGSSPAASRTARSTPAASRFVRSAARCDPALLPAARRTAHRRAVRAAQVRAALRRPARRGPRSPRSARPRARPASGTAPCTRLGGRCWRAHAPAPRSRSRPPSRPPDRPASRACDLPEPARSPHRLLSSPDSSALSFILRSFSVSLERGPAVRTLRASRVRALARRPGGRGIAAAGDPVDGLGGAESLAP